MLLVHQRLPHCPWDLWITRVPPRRARPSAAPRSSSRRAASGSAVRCRPAGRSGVSANTVAVGPSLAAGGPSAADEFDRLLGVGLELPRRRSCPVSAGAGRCRLSSTVRAARACSWCPVPARVRPFVSERLARPHNEVLTTGFAAADLAVGRRPACSRSCRGDTRMPDATTRARSATSTGASASRTPRSPTLSRPAAAP